MLWKDFKRYAIGLTGRICQAAEELGKQYQRPVIYLASSQASKEDEARRIQERDGIKERTDRGDELCGAVPDVADARQPREQEVGAKAGMGEV